MNEAERLRFEGINRTIKTLQDQVDALDADLGSWPLAGNRDSYPEFKFPKKEPWEWWLPKETEPYFTIDGAHNINRFVWTNSKLGADYRKNHNVFKTEEDAKLFQHLNRHQRAVAWVLRELNDGWVPDWTNAYNNKYYFTYKHKMKRIEVYFTVFIQEHNNLLYGKSEEVMKECQEIIAEESCSYFR